MLFNVNIITGKLFKIHQEKRKIERNIDDANGHTYLAYTSTFSRSESCWVSLSAKILGVIRFDGISISSLAKFCAPESNKPSWKSWCHVCKRDFSSLLKDSIKWKYCIYSINHPGRLLKCWTLIVGTYSRWALIRGWALIKFSPFSAIVVCLFCNKIINGNNKKQRCNKARFL